MLKHQFALPPLSILIFLTSACLVAGVERPGVCPYMTGLSNVESEWLNYQGRWFMQLRSFEDGFRCQRTDYNIGTNSEHTVQTFEIRNRDDVIHVTTGTVTFGQDGQVQIQYSGRDPFIFKVLSVDYSKYLITYFCQNLPSRRYNG
ncbi:bilin-binding protein-like [Eurosta solidaginis]|uniref:bilin-binding protein-like n=1 Tax=Eurosta solidaginis TaxID=178769 RepID=UPI00353151ED